jgi:carbon monoxide dehydrogenase subunit G
VELEHDFTVPASVEETWAAFNDPEQVAPCFPGATLLSVEGDKFTGSAKIKLGPIALQYNGVGTYVERDASAHRAVIEARGKDKRGNGTANATVTAQMSPDAEGTAVHVTTDLAVTGKPAQFGRGVMQDVSDKLLGQFVACLKTTLGAQQAAGQSGQSSAADPKPSRADPKPSPADPQPSAAGLRSATEPQQSPVDAKPVLVEEVADPISEDSPVTAPYGGATNGEPAPRTQASSYKQAASPTLRKVPPAPEVDVEINLLSTVGRVLLTRVAARALGPVALGVGVAVGYLLGRRARH